MILESVLSGVVGLTIPKTVSMTAEIEHVCYDSRLAKPSSLFVCLKGAFSDGHLYALSAYEKGCRFFIAERWPDALPEDAHVIFSDDSRRTLAEISGNIFGHPARKLHLIGITGTKGKTTIALLIYNILRAFGVPCGYIGTSGIDYADCHEETANTTPESYILQETMQKMSKAGVTHVIMEVSSQALFTHRVHGLTFQTAVFTNLSEDHIGEFEHPSFEHYKNCKKSLFSSFGVSTAILNADDPYAEEFAAAAASADVKRFSSSRPDADYFASDIVRFREADKLGIRFSCHHHGRTDHVTQCFPGFFSVYNALAVFAVCHTLGLKTEQITEALAHVSISGRFEMVPALPYATFIIDYAHNRISLQSALETLREYEPKRLICLFGSVGGRTRSRRVEMGRVAAELADFSILTSDNPDAEDPSAILSDIATQFREVPHNYIAIPDRAEAIRYAVSMAREGDIFLLAGKGHEKYQLIFGQKVPFCERDILLDACQDLLNSLPIS